MLSDNTLYIRNDLLKLIYSGMLLNFSLDEIRLFWQSHTLPGMDSQRNEADFYRFIWNEKNRVPLDYFVVAMTAFEKFLLQKDICPCDFVKETLHDVNRGAIVGAKTLLLWIQPFMDILYSGTDLRTLILRALPALSQNMAPGFIHEIVRFESGENETSVWMLLMHGQQPQMFKNPDKTFFCALPRYDAELWAATFTRYSPTILRLPAFEQLNMVCETRSLSEITSNVDNHCYTADKQLQNRSDMVQTRLFSEFCAEQGIDLARFKIPDCTIELVAADLPCPTRKKMLIHRSCAYGAPVVLYRLTYKPLVKRPENFMSDMLEEAVSDPRAITKSITLKHHQLIDQATFAARFVFNVCIYLDGERKLADNFFDIYPGVPTVIDWPHKQAPHILFTGNQVT